MYGDKVPCFAFKQIRKETLLVYLKDLKIFVVAYLSYFTYIFD